MATILGELEERAEALRIELDAAREVAKLREASLAETFAATLEEERAKRAAVERDLARRVEAYENLLKRCDASSPWYRSNWFTFAAGAVLSGGACAAVSIAR